MALAISELTSSYDNTDATSYTTASVSPSASSLLCVMYSTRHGTTAPAVTVSGGGLTWVEKVKQIDGISMVGSFVAQCPASPGSFTITLSTVGAVTAIGAAWSVLQVTGHSTAAPVAQFPTGATGSTGTTATVTFAALSDSNNAQILHVIHRANESQSAEAGWTAGTSRSGSAPNYSSLATWKIGSADLSATQTWTTSARWQGSGLEIAIAATPPDVTTPNHIVHLGTTRVLASTSGTSLTLAYPDGYTPIANDLGIISMCQTGSNSSITTPSGWTLIKRTERSTTHVQAIYRKKFAGSDAIPSIVTASSSAVQATISIFRNVDTTTAEDATAVSNTGTTANGHTGADIGTLTTAAAAIITFACADNVANIYGISLYDQDQNAAFTANGGEYGESAGASSQSVGSCIAYHHQAIANQTDRPRTHTFIPNQADLLGGGWIATTIALRPSDPTAVPVPRDLYGAAIQVPLQGSGAECAGADPFNTRLVVQAFNPHDGGGDVWYDSSAGSYWDIGQWAGPGRWSDITTRVRGVQWQNGADQPAGRPRIATSTIELDNADGLASPWATSGAFTSGSESWLRTGTLMRIAFCSTSADLTVGYGRSIFTGKIESVDEASTWAADAWVTVQLIEPLSALATYNGIEQAEQGGGEGLYDRLERLLNDAHWPYRYGLGSGEVPSHATAATFTGTTMAGERLAEVYLLGDSAGVYIYGHNNGTILVNNPATSVPSLTFSNKPTGGELPLASATPYANNQRILNVAIASRVDGHEVQIQDWPSVSKFGRIDTGNGWPRRDLICQSDTTIAAILNAVLAFRGGDDRGVAQITVDCDMDPTSLFSHLAFLRLFENVDVRWVHPTLQALEYTQTSYVEAMAHQVTKQGPQMKWVATLSLARYPD